MAFEELGKAFVSHYYTTMAGNREKLSELYSDTSMMTFEGVPCQGKANICEKLSSLSFKTIQHNITSLDCQPVLGLTSGDGVLVMVMGQLKTDDDPPHSFAQSFVLQKSATNFYIANEVFRMILHD